MSTVVLPRSPPAPHLRSTRAGVHQQRSRPPGRKMTAPLYRTQAGGRADRARVPGALPRLSGPDSQAPRNSRSGHSTVCAAPVAGAGRSSPTSLWCCVHRQPEHRWPCRRSNQLRFHQCIERAPATALPPPTPCPNRLCPSDRVRRAVLSQSGCSSRSDRSHVMSSLENPVRFRLRQSSIPRSLPDLTELASKKLSSQKCTAWDRKLRSPTWRCPACSCDVHVPLDWRAEAFPRERPVRPPACPPPRAPPPARYQRVGNPLAAACLSFTRAPRSTLTIA